MTLQVIVGGQYGSEGKGAVAAWLASRQSNLMAVRVAGPNAGHTVIGRCPPECPDRLQVLDRAPGKHQSDAHPWRLRHVPVAAVTNETALLALAAGSEIDPHVLVEELYNLDAAGYKASDRMIIDPTATLIQERHRQIESASRTHPELEPDYAASLVSRIGSTGKGVGAARSDRAMRVALTADQFGWPDGLIEYGDVGMTIRKRLRDGGNVQIEGTQGYLLGQHAGYYPQCTSSDCTAMDFLAMAGAPPWLADLQVWVVFRTYPIRVAGNSGPLPNEVSWEDVGQPEELTTVTRKVRRVARWDALSARQAMEANGAGSVVGYDQVRAALTMADYVIPSIAGTTSLATLEPHQLDLIDQLVAARSKDLGALVDLLGTGPSTMINYHRERTT